MEDPVEDCSDGEADEQARVDECDDQGVAARPVPPRTPEQVGRFAALRGAQRSGGEEPRPAAAAANIMMDDLRGPSFDQGADPLRGPSFDQGADLDMQDTVPARSEPSLEGAALAEDAFARLDAQERALPSEEPEQEQDGSSEASDDEPMGDAAAEAGLGSTTSELPDEPWARWSRQERELWERVRPRTLRREALEVQGLRFPAAVVNRIMRLNPDLHMKSSEAQEVISLSTVILVKALAKAMVRGKLPGQRVTMEDVRSACGNLKELQFLQPLSCTLDASASILRKGDVDAPAAEERPGQASKRSKVGPPIPGQGTLSVSAFTANAAAPEGADELEGADEDAEGENRENEPNQLPAGDAKRPDVETRNKRKAKETATPKKPAKAPRRTADKTKKVQSKPESAVAGKKVTKLESFFKRADNAGE